MAHRPLQRRCRARVWPVIRRPASRFPGRSRIRRAVGSSAARVGRPPNAARRRGSDSSSCHRGLGAVDSGQRAGFSCGLPSPEPNSRIVHGWWAKFGLAPRGRRATARRDPISAGYVFSPAARAAVSERQSCAASLSSIDRLAADLLRDRVGDLGKPGGFWHGNCPEGPN